jgi:hypothetical protein
MTAGIAYVDGPRLSRSLFAAADWVAAGRDEINRINVFPVPDGDTGTNFSLTLRAVADALRALGDRQQATARPSPAACGTEPTGCMSRWTTRAKGPSSLSRAKPPPRPSAPRPIRRTSESS